MAPEFKPGEIVHVDTKSKLQDSDFVVVRHDREMKVRKIVFLDDDTPSFTMGNEGQSITMPDRMLEGSLITGKVIERNTFY